MSKMREAFEKWYATRLYVSKFAPQIADDAFQAGYQAAIAAVKEGGEDAWLCMGVVSRAKGCRECVPLYKLPED